MFRRKEYKLLNQMLDDAIAGKYDEMSYDESELSKLQVKWKRYLTSAKMSERELNKERENLKQLITNISHQTKTPLTTILLYAQLLEEQINDDNCQMYINQIITYSNKLETLIQMLVKMSRLEIGIFQYHQEMNQLNQLVEKIIALGKVNIEVKQITIEYENNIAPWALFDLKWTEEAIYNILDNAIKYSPEQSKIIISLFEYEMFAGISITDEGIGLSEEEIPCIFSRFYRGKAVKNQEGIGVGLYLTRQIIEGQGGYIKVSSKVGWGSKFEVFLPKQ